MQFKARIIEVLPEQTGEGKGGNWRKQSIIVETDGDYPKKICLTIWGDKVSYSLRKVGIRGLFSINVESRQFNGNWYSEIKCYKIEAENDNF